MTFQDFKDCKEIMSVKTFNDKFGSFEDFDATNNKQIHSFDGFWISEDINGTFYTVADRSELTTKDFDFAVEWFWDNFGKYELMKDNELEEDLHGRIAQWIANQGLRAQSLDAFDFTTDEQKGMQTYYLDKIDRLNDHFEWKKEQQKRFFPHVKTAFRQKKRINDLIIALGGDWIDCSWHNDEEDSISSQKLGLHIFVLSSGGFSMSNSYADTNDEEKYFDEVETIEELKEQIEEAQPDIIGLSIPQFLQTIAEQLAPLKAKGININVDLSGLFIHYTNEQGQPMQSAITPSDIQINE